MGPPLPVGLLFAAGRLALGLTSVAEGAGVCEPPPQADRATAATAVRIMRPRPCRCATPNMRPPLVPSEPAAYGRFGDPTAPGSNELEHHAQGITTPCRGGRTSAGD